ncbi:hypothetical protein WA026_002874 [Henosepilachna vigintioctopunctata]|uniref:Reverse transcriptase domain-containing protein n=1 Tax=Henosepilachna vigintioctopunctata TaxID=420089 RepID=A0AAW1TN12_9CUCU
MYSMMCGVDWSKIMEIDDPNEACNMLYEILEDIFRSTVPFKKGRTRRFPHWYTSELIKLIRMKEVAYRNYKKFKKPSYGRHYSSLRAMVKSEIGSLYKAYIATSEHFINEDPSRFWSFIQDKRGCTRIPGIMQHEQSVYNNPNDIVNAFADYFSSVYSDASANCDIVGENSGNTLVFIECITEDMIKVAARKLNNKLTAGPDLILSFIVKDCIDSLIMPLKHIYDLILKTSIFPTRWKVAKVIPVLKKGDSSHIGNYRSISILSNFSKLFEIILFNSIYPKIRNSIAIEQHGFMTRRSCTTNLAQFSQFIYEELDGAGQVDVVYTDFQKAFDKINHKLLIVKTRKLFGFSNNLSLLMESYLSNRSQFVQIENSKSRKFRVTSGVPQGSNLGPLLFVLFVNDLLEMVDCMKVAYADDIKIYKSVSSMNDCLRLQSDLNDISRWCNNNCLHLNVMKCNVVNFTRKRNVISFDYNIEGVNLTRLQEVKDLGVVFDQKLSFIPHINQLILSCSKVYGFIVRNARLFSSSSTLVHLFNALVRSKLEYGCLVWRPIYNCHINRLEALQRKFLKWLAFREDGLYPPRGCDHACLLSRFDTRSLHTRRSLNALKFLFNLLNDNLDCPELLGKLNFFVPPRCTRISQTFYLKTHRTNLLSQSPLSFVCSTANQISSCCDLHWDSLVSIVNKYLNLNSEVS